MVVSPRKEETAIWKQGALFSPLYPTKLKVLSKNKTVILISAYHDVAQNHEKQKKIGGLYRLVDIKS